MTNQQFSETYSELYDLLHDNKNYASEVETVFSLVLKDRGTPPKSVIDLACGTGRHLVKFAQLGLQIHGNDISSGMISRTENRLLDAGVKTYNLTNSPMQSVVARSDDSGEGFELATAFYTALGYLVEPSELDNFFRHMTTVLIPGGYLFCDLWNGHKMAREFSPSRTRQAENATTKVTRVSSVTHVPAQNSLNVSFKFEVQNKTNSTIEYFEETHLVRYHTVPEIENILKAHGFELVSIGPFFDDAKLAEDAWNFYFLARLKS